MLAAQIGQIILSLKLNGGMRKDFDNAVYKETLVKGGCVDSDGKAVVCSAAAKQAIWGSICEEGYTLDGEVCSSKIS
jgi:hypothetical protein